MGIRLRGGFEEGQSLLAIFVDLRQLLGFIQIVDVSGVWVGFGEQYESLVVIRVGVSAISHSGEVGIVGLNAGVAAPMAFFPFAGWKSSFFGDLPAHGKDAVSFVTEQKVITSRWF